MRISAMVALAVAAAFASGCGGAAVGCTRAAVKVGAGEAKFGAGAAKTGAVVGSDGLEAAARGGSHLGAGEAGQPMSRLGKAGREADGTQPKSHEWPHWVTEPVKQGAEKLPQVLGGDGRDDDRQRDRRAR